MISGDTYIPCTVLYCTAVIIVYVYRYKERLDLPVSAQKVIPVPDISIHVRNGKKDDVLLLACDGIFDVMSNTEAIDYMRLLISNYRQEGGAKHAGNAPEMLCRDLIDTSLVAGSTDNMSVIMAAL